MASVTSTVYMSLWPSEVEGPHFGLVYRQPVVVGESRLEFLWQIKFREDRKILPRCLLDWPREWRTLGFCFAFYRLVWFLVPRPQRMETLGASKQQNPFGCHQVRSLGSNM